MKDSFGREIEYMRISLTDRCNLRCCYCMPHDVEFIPHEFILSYEEILRICSVVKELGINRFKVTGGEPLVRKGCVNFIRSLKNMDGVEQVTMTTNGMLLGDCVEELEDMGLFDSIYKKPVPRYCQKIGIVTALTGAAVRDIINVSTRRNPNVYIRLLPVPVQGEGAAEKIASGIEYMNRNRLADVLILARGGGSLEDLWPFNEEIVAHSIYNSEIPIISAVGHETDFTIADFVADLRAPTPSAAAELAVPDIYEVRRKIDTYQDRLRMSLIKKVELMKLRYEKAMSSSVFKEPLRKVNDNYLKIDSYFKQIENAMKVKQEKEKTRYIELVAKLDTLSPLKTLYRGYSITEKDNKIIKSKEELKQGDLIHIKFMDGEKQAMVK